MRGYPHTWWPRRTQLILRRRHTARWTMLGDPMSPQKGLWFIDLDKDYSSTRYMTLVYTLIGIMVFLGTRVLGRPLGHFVFSLVGFKRIDLRNIFQGHPRMSPERV